MQSAFTIVLMLVAILFSASPIILIGALLLMIYSPPFRYFVLTCTALLAVVTVLGGMAIDWDKQQTMARECSPAGFAERQKQIDYWDLQAKKWPDLRGNSSEDQNRNTECNKWLAERKQ